MLRDYKAKLYVSDDACPKFCRARPVPLAMKPMVEKELERLVEQGILSPVQFAEWAAPVVPVLKSDKQSVRICGDFKLTVNQVAKLDRYPIPKADDLLANLASGVPFTKLDLSQAYQQVCLDEESKKLVVINTHKGLFQFNRLSCRVCPILLSSWMTSSLLVIPKRVICPRWKKCCNGYPMWGSVFRRRSVSF